MARWQTTQSGVGRVTGPGSRGLLAALVIVLGGAAQALAQISDDQARSSGPGHPWQTSLPGINLYSRAKYTEVALFSIPARGGPIAMDVSLLHNSKAVGGNPAIGGKWRHSYDTELRLDPQGSRAAVVWGNHTVQQFEDRSGVLVPLDGHRDELSASGASYVLTARTTRVQFTFEPTADPLVHRLKTVSDPNGNRLTLAYDAMGRLTRVTDPANRQARFVYSATSGKLTQVKYQVGTWSRVWKLTYNAAGNLASVKWPPVTDDAGTSTYTDKFAYNARGNITRWTDRLGKAWTYGYDAVDPDAMRWAQWPGNTAAQRMEYRAPSAGRRVVIDPRESAWTYSYDAMSRLVSTTDPYGAVTTLAYADPDYAWAPSDVVSPTGVAAQHDYDSRANEVGFIDTFGSRWDYEYDGANQLVRVLEPRSTDAWGNLEPDRRERSHEYDARGNLVRMKSGWMDTTLETWLRVHDDHGQLVCETDPLGNATKYTYDSYGNLIQATSAAGRVTTYEYADPDSTFGFAQPSAVVNGAGERTDFTRDEWGRLRTTSCGDANPCEYAYDAMGRLIAVDNDRGSPPVQFTHSPLGLVVDEFELGSQVSVHRDYLPDGAQVAYTVASPSATSTFRLMLGLDDRLDALNADGSVTSFAYDADARLTSKALANGVVTSYVYDSAGRLSDIDQAGRDDVVGYAYAYQANGLLASETSLTDDQVRYGYDHSGRIVREQGLGAYAHDMGCLYDGAGRRVSVVRDGVETIYTFDADGLVLGADSGGVPEQYVWDGAARLVDTVREGDLYHCWYDGRSRLVAIDSYDNIFGWHRSHEYTYDALDRRIARNTFDFMGQPLIHNEYRFAGSRLVQRDESDWRAGTTTIGVTTWAHGLLCDVGWPADYPDGSTTQWAFTDISGSLRAITDDAGASTGYAAAYNTFGEVIDVIVEGDPMPMAWRADAGPLSEGDAGMVDLPGPEAYDPRIAMTTNGAALSTGPGVPQRGGPALLRRIRSGIGDGYGDACDNCPNVVADRGGACDDGDAECGFFACQDGAGGCPFRPKPPRHMYDCRRCHKTQSEELAERFYEWELAEHNRTCPLCNPPKPPTPGSGPSCPPDSDPRWVWMGGGVGWVYRTPGGGGIPY